MWRKVGMNTYNSISNTDRELIAQTVNGTRKGADKNINSEALCRHRRHWQKIISNICVTEKNKRFI